MKRSFKMLQTKTDMWEILVRKIPLDPSSGRAIDYMSEDLGNAIKSVLHKFTAVDSVESRTVCSSGVSAPRSRSHPSDTGLRRPGKLLEGSFSAASKRNCAREYVFESSRGDLQNTLLCTALKSQFFVKKLPNFR